MYQQNSEKALLGVVIAPLPPPPPGYASARTLIIMLRHDCSDSYSFI